MHIGFWSLPEMDITHDAGPGRDAASLAFGSDPLAGKAADMATGKGWKYMNN